MKQMCLPVLLIGIILGLPLLQVLAQPQPKSPPSRAPTILAPPAASADSETTAQKILRAAKQQLANRTIYIEEYQSLKYPGGDVPADTGVCTDLVIRACRAAGVDLQKELHEDRVAHPQAYPTRIWDNKKADKNIDHRRCQNLTVWFKRHAQSLPTQTDAESLKKHWQPGDIVFFIMEGKSHPWHVAIVSDEQDKDGMPLIIEGYPPCVSAFRRLDAWAPIYSHFRLNETEDPTSKGQPKPGVLH